MATNIRLKHLLPAILLLLVLAPVLSAQSAGYFIVTENGETSFIQRLAWTGGEYASRYEVEIEREAGGTFLPYLRESTETHFIEVSLPPGRYRFQVTSYNVLDRPEEVSQWENIEVRPAVRPEIFDVLLELVFGGSDGELSGYALNITGNNIESGAEFFIRRSNGTEIIPETLDLSGGNSAKVFIDGGYIISDECELVIRNPGGLESAMGGIVFPHPEEEKPLKPVLLLAGAAWAPVFPLYGDLFGEGPSLIGAGMRIGAAFLIPGGIYAGAEAAVFWHLNADDVLSGNVLSLGGNLLAMKWLPNRTMALNYRLGLSFILLPETKEAVMPNIGISFLWQFSGIYTLEAGIDYVSRIKENSFDGCIRPWIGVGVVF